MLDLLMLLGEILLIIAIFMLIGLTIKHYANRWLDRTMKKEEQVRIGKNDTQARENRVGVREGEVKNREDQVLLREDVMDGKDKAILREVKSRNNNG